MPESPKDYLLARAILKTLADASLAKQGRNAGITIVGGRFTNCGSGIEVVGPGLVTVVGEIAAHNSGPLLVTKDGGEIVLVPDGSTT